MKLLDGKQYAGDILGQLEARVKLLPEKPGLGVLLVGDNPASLQYVRLKQKAAEQVGIQFELVRLPGAATRAEILAALEALQARAEIHGVLVQLPLPRPEDTSLVLGALRAEKDVDGFLPGSPVKPVLVQAVATLISAAGETGKRMVVVGKSDVFLQAFPPYFGAQGFEVITVHPGDATVRDMMRTADVLVVAVGKAAFVRAEDVKPGAVVIDIGTNRVGDGVGGLKTVGDAAEDVRTVAGAISPVPGGVGPLTVAHLLQNVVELAQKSQGK